MSKKVLTILLTALIFLSCVTLGVATVFRVSDVAVVANVVSEHAKAESESLKKELSALYTTENIFSVEQAQMDNILMKYPYLRVTEFKKSYPNKVVVSILEEAEVYAVEDKEGKDFILSKEGTILEYRSSSANRLDGAKNVLLKGLSVQEVNGSLSGDDCWQSMLALCQSMDEKTGGIRSNVISVEILSRTPETFYLITMREGVKIYIRNPNSLTEEKAKTAIDKYMGLSDEERMTGRLMIFDVNGTVFSQYSLQDDF